MLRSQGKQIFLIVAFAGAICSVGLEPVIIGLIGGQTPQVAELFMQLPTKANLRAFERDLEDDCWLARRLRPWMQYARFMTLRELPDKAVTGRGGWLFYKPGVQYLVDQWSPPIADSHGDIFSAVVSFRDQLSERGIRLLLVPVPDKASVYPDMLTKRATAAPVFRQEDVGAVNSKTLGIISRLQQAEIEVVDLFAVFERARSSLSPAASTTYYLSQDSHWSPAGMRLAAKEVGQRILTLGWLRKGQAKYDLAPVTIKWHGDILKMIQVPRIENEFEPEQIDCTQVIDTIAHQPYHDDPNSEVLVLGDSFLRIYSEDEPGSGGFVAHLASELGFALASLINDGGAATLARQQLSRNPALLANKKVVVWEFAERDIRFAAGGWQIVPLGALPGKVTSHGDAAQRFPGP